MAVCLREEGFRINTIVCRLFGPGLLANNGVPHRRQRKLLNPSFAPTHIRNLTQLVHKISRELRDAVAKNVSDGGNRGREVDIAEWFSRAGLEMIARAGFGHSFHAFQGEGDAFARAVKAIAYVILYSLIDVATYLHAQTDFHGDGISDPLLHYERRRKLAV